MLIALILTRSIKTSLGELFCAILFQATTKIFWQQKSGTTVYYTYILYTYKHASVSVCVYVHVHMLHAYYLCTACVWRVYVYHSTYLWQVFYVWIHVHTYIQYLLFITGSSVYSGALKIILLVHLQFTAEHIPHHHPVSLCTVHCYPVHAQVLWQQCLPISSHYMLQ